MNTVVHVKATNALGALIAVALLAGGCRVGVSADLTTGNREFTSGHFERALERYQQAERSRPQDPAALFGIGVSLYRLQRYEEAAGAFTAAAAGLDNPDDRARALHNLGNAVATIERFDEALEAYRQALRLADRENTRLNYLLIRNRRGGSSSGTRGQSGVSKAPSDDGLFDVARQFDAPARRHEARDPAARRASDW
jgi:tetratricopeptide (TPR) repeat protein